MLGRKKKESVKETKAFRSYPGVALDLAEKELPIIELPIKKGTDYGEVIFMGDMHVGSDGFSEHQFLAYVRWIKKHPYLRVVLMGDLVEVADLSNYLQAQTEDFKRQIKRVINLLWPIKDQIVCILEGNHEERYAKEVKGAIHLSDYLALELGIKEKTLRPGPQKGQLMVFKVGNEYYPVYAIHGHTSAVYNKGTQLKRMAFNTKIPLICHGHTHQIYHDHYVYRTVNQIGEKFYEGVFEQHWLITGCFVKYLGYAEQRAYPMSKIGAPFVRFSSKDQGMMIITDALFFYGIGKQGKRRSDKDPVDKWLVRGFWKLLKLGRKLKFWKEHKKSDFSIRTLETGYISS